MAGQGWAVRAALAALRAWWDELVDAVAYGLEVRWLGHREDEGDVER